MAGVTINIGANTSQLNQSFQQSQQAITAALTQITAALQRLAGQSTQATNTVVQNNKNATQSFQNTANQAHTAHGHLSQSFTELINKAGEFVIAYLAAKEAIEQVKATVESMDTIQKLATNMGVSTEKAATLITGLRSVDVSLQQFQGTLTTTTSILSSNEKMLTKWGVTTRDSNNHLVDQATLFENVRQRIAEYADGTDRATAASKLWGVDLDTANKLLQLTPEALEAARTKTEAFGTTLTESGKKAMDDFKRASGDLESAVTGLRNAFYEQLLPTITQVLNFISSNAPSALGILRDAGQFVVDTFNWMANTVGYIFNTLGSAIHDTLDQTGVQEIEWGKIIANVANIVQAAVAIAVGAIVALWNTVTTTMQVLRTSLTNTAEAVEQAFKLDWEGVKAVWRRNLTDVGDIVSNYGKTIVGNANKVWTDVQNALMGQGLGGNAKGSGISPWVAPWLQQANQSFGEAPKGFRQVTNETIRGGVGGDASALLKAQIELMKAELQAQLNELKTALQGQKDVLDQALKDNTISYADYYAKLDAMAQEETQKEVDLLQAQIKAQQDMLAKATKEEDKLRIQAQIITLQSQINVLKEKEGQIEARNAAALADKQKQMEKMHADLASQVAQASGVTDVAVQMKAIEAQYKDMRDRMAAESDVEGMSLLDKLMGFKEAELKLKAFQEKFDQAQTEMQTRVTELDTLGKQQGYTDYTAEQKKIELYGQEVDKLIEIKQAQLEVAAAAYGADSAQVASIKNTIAQLQNLKTPLSQVSKQIKEAITDQIADFFTTVMNGTKSLKEALKDLINGIVQAINKIVAEALAKKLMMSFETSGAGGWVSGLFGGGGSSGGDGGGGFLSSIFGSIFGGRATGGTVATGMPYLIGENGPELFVPRTSGTVVPNHLARSMALQGNSAPNVTVNIDTPDPHTFRKTRQQWMADLSKSVQRASNRNN